MSLSFNFATSFVTDVCDCVVLSVHWCTSSSGLFELSIRGFPVSGELALYWYSYMFPAFYAGWYLHFCCCL